MILYWLEDEYIGYLREWENGVQQRNGFNSSSKENYGLK